MCIFKHCMSSSLDFLLDLIITGNCTDLESKAAPLRIPVVALATYMYLGNIVRMIQEEHSPCVSQRGTDPAGLFISF